MPGVDLQVIANALPVARGRGLHGRAAPGVEIVGVRRQSNRPSRSLTLNAPNTRISAAHAGRAQRRAFFDVGARQQFGAGVLERARHLAGAVPVRVRLDDRDDAGRSDRLLAAQTNSTMLAVVAP